MKTTPASTDHAPRDLNGRIALVTGATRGAGRAIARELAAAGATVYCTGRSTAAAPSDYGRPETVEETASLIREAGGKAHAVLVDHRDISAVRQLVERIDQEQGRLDILVNDIGGEAYVEFGIPLWEYGYEAGQRLLETGFLTHLITSQAALGLMVRHPGALVVEVTDGTREYNRAHYRETVYLDITKTAVDRLAFAQGHELAPYGGDLGFRVTRVAAFGDDAGWFRCDRADLA